MEHVLATLTNLDTGATQPLVWDGESDAVVIPPGRWRCSPLTFPAGRSLAVHGEGADVEYDGIFINPE
jgi:hypothetical protein